MITTATRIEDLTLGITEEIHVRASLDATFAALLEQLGPHNEGPESGPMPMKLEAWPGGRWFRDFGNDTGHFWGHVQAIRPPTLLEICGPLFMSSPVTSNVQYRLTEQAGLTRVQFAHRAMGWIGGEYRDGVNVDQGWTSLMTRIRLGAEGRSGRR